MQKWPVRILGFALGVVGFGFAVFLLFSAIDAATHENWTPRGAGWLFGGIACGVAGARILEAFVPIAIPLVKKGSSRHRYILAGWSLWVLGVLAWVFTFDPFGSYWSREEWVFLWKIMLVPPFFATICFVVFVKLSRQPDDLT